jgi:hypothetical protein
MCAYPADYENPYRESLAEAEAEEEKEIESDDNLQRASSDLWGFACAVFIIVIIAALVWVVLTGMFLAAGWPEKFAGSGAAKEPEVRVVESPEIPVDWDPGPEARSAYLVALCEQAVDEERTFLVISCHKTDDGYGEFTLHCECRPDGSVWLPASGEAASEHEFHIPGPIILHKGEVYGPEVEK